MKKTTLLKSMLLLCALVVGSNSLWATDYVECYTLTVTTGSDNGYATAEDIVISEITWNVTGNATMNPWRIGCAKKSTMSSENRAIFSKTAISDNVSKIVITHGEKSNITVNSMAVSVHSSADDAASGSNAVATFSPSYVDDGTVTITKADETSWAGKYYRIVYNLTKTGTSNPGYIQFSEAKFYKEKVDITSISLPSTESVSVGGTVTLTPTVSPANYTETIDWESDDTGVATVNSAGVVSGVSVGTANIKAKAHDNPSTIYGECTVTVTAPIAVTGVTLKSSTTIELGKTETLVPTISPADATNKNVIWVSDDDSKVSVDDDGVITGLALTGGSPVTITVITEDGDFEAECAVTVIPKNTDVDLTSPISITTWPSISYGAAAEYEVEGVCFTATQCYKNSGLQFKASSGILASPLIKSTYGYTVFVTTNTTGTGTLTLQIGSETPVNISSGSSTTYSATTSSTSTSFTLTNSSGNACNIASLSIIPNTTVTLNAKGFATYSAAYDFTFSGAEAYQMALDEGEKTITGTKVTGKIKAGEGILFKGSAGASVTIAATTGATALTGNDLKGSTKDDGTTADKPTYCYVLSGDTFVSYSGATLAANKAYFEATKDLAGRAFTITFDDEETTNIIGVEAKKFVEDNTFYNLAGQRVAQPTKGLYIVNGKKVVIK